MYDKTKVRRFNEYIIEEYTRDLVVEYIAKVTRSKTSDNSFIQIGIRPLLDNDIFTSPSMSEYLPGAGKMIAMGERDFLIKDILDNNKIKVIEFKEKIKDLPGYIGSNETIVLISTKFYVEFFTQLMNRIEYGQKYPLLDKKNRIISVPEKVLKNKIIIIEKDAILWKKQVFSNKETKEEGTIDIRIKPFSNDKVDITIRSVNKIDQINPHLIKILEVKE